MTRMSQKKAQQILEREAERERRETAEIKEVKLEPHSDITAAVYWPGEGYGGGEACQSMEDARNRVRALVNLGYGKPSKNPIRVVITRREIYEFTI